MAVTETANTRSDVTPLSISARDLHVRYRVYEEKPLRGRELIKRGLRSRRSTEVHALQGIDLDVRVGESVGIVGANGSGKSTLLRCLAGVQSVSEGVVMLRGHAQLLAVGAALRPALSGRRNIWLGGLAMGLSPKDLDERIESVVEFAGIGGAIDRPMNTYSSGMRARLAFSIATMREPEILLIDEALAVGDRKFRNRSLRRIREIRERANTVVMVTHNLGEIKATCDRTIWLDAGKIVMDAPTSEVLATYADDEDDVLET